MASRWRRCAGTIRRDCRPSCRVALDPTGVGGLRSMASDQRAMAGRPASSAGNSGFSTLSCSPNRSSVGARARSAEFAAAHERAARRCEDRVERVERRREAGPLVVGGTVPRAVDEAHGRVQDLDDLLRPRHPQSARRLGEPGVQEFRGCPSIPRRARRCPRCRPSSSRRATLLRARASSALCRCTTGACPAS